MRYESEFNFFRKLLRNFHLNSHVLMLDAEEIPTFDLGLRQLLFGKTDYRRLFHEPLENSSPNTVYRILDEYLCNYIFFKLPDTAEDMFLIIGPYAQTEHPLKVLCNYAEMLSIPKQLFPQLEKFYAGLPLIPEESALLALVNTFGETIWNGLDNFSLEYIERSLPADCEPIAARPDYYEPEEAFLSMRVLEERYASENRMIQAVSQGLVHKAEMLITNNDNHGMEERIADPIRNIKNYSIILNTLLRKGAEAGAVHPLHIDSISSKFAREIELVHSLEEGYALQKKMVRKYCLLVKNHSMKGYSLLIRKVLTCIDYDLTADLSLKAQAEMLNVNASYLSTLFKKETGTTLTDYVNRKRIEHAVFLLNSSNMQIQTVAQYCGIPDVNYFTKIFKKYINWTPKEYRDHMMAYTP